MFPFIKVKLISIVIINIFQKIDTSNILDKSSRYDISGNPFPLSHFATALSVIFNFPTNSFGLTFIHFLTLL